MEKNTYKIKRLFYYQLFQKHYDFNTISEEIGYEPNFLKKIINGEISASKNEIKNILNFIELSENDLIEDDEFKNQNETKLKSAFNLFLDNYEK